MEWRSLVPELVVSDFEKSLQFYVSVLGFTVKYKRANPLFAYLEFEESQIMIEELEEDSWVVGELAHPFGRGMNLQIECSDVAAIRKRIDVAGIAVFRELYDAYYEAAGAVFGQRQFLVADPDGYLLRFCQVISERRLDV
jgi:catechol 2,3-dioxygenase-like lactoylglutathione lyase family enzyme